MPEEISKLRKLRHRLGDKISSIVSHGGMTFLQNKPSLRVDDDGVVIRELVKLKQLRELAVLDFRAKHEKTLCSLINNMQLLEVLGIATTGGSEVIDLHITSTFRNLVLYAKLKIKVAKLESTAPKSCATVFDLLLVD